MPTNSFIEKDGELPESRGPSKFHIHEYSGVPTAENDDDDRAEKPWQRVPSTLLVILMGVYFLIAYLTQLVEDDMPRAIMNESLSRDNSDTFSEEVAYRNLLLIVGEGPRVSGTRYHLQKTQDLKTLIDTIAAEATIPVTTLWQMETADYYLNMSYPFANYYQNCSNIIALLEGESGVQASGRIGSSILVNCHYDSVPFADGASDNAVFCAVMAETLAKLSRRTTKLKHNIVFLFNGAEENNLQGSHAFLQHPWAQDVVAVINLDAAGMNGKPAVFQASDPRVLSAYSRAVGRPVAQGMAEFLFKTGIIPSDTDFRVFRDFGNIHGVDIAFTKWGNVYHTRNDKVSLLQPGVLQNAGNMLLALLADVADQEEMGQRASPEQVIYYDYLNAFMLTYSFTASYVTDVFIAAFGLVTVYYYVWLVGARWSTVLELLYACLGRVAAMAAGLVVTVIFIAIMVAVNMQMRYLSQPWLVVPLYWLPYIITAVGVAQLYDAWRWKRSGLTRSLRSLQAQAATRLILSAITLILACIPGITSSRYLFSLPLFIISLTSIISITMVRYVRLTGWQHLILEVVLSLPSTMLMLMLVLRLDAMMLPITGRSANDTPDYIVGFLNLGMVAWTSITVSGIELLFSRKRLWIVLSVVGSVCVILMFIPFSPYDENGIALQRHYWFHSQITSHDISGVPTSQTSGILVTKFDPYTLDGVVPALTAAGNNVETRVGFGDDCVNKIYCGMPLYRTSFGVNYPKALFLYTGPPAPFSPAASLSALKSCTGDTCTYNFTMIGGAHNIVTFWARPNITMSSWSLQSPVHVTFVQQDRPVYLFYHSAATYMEQWSFQFSVMFNVPVSLQSGPIVDVSHHSHKLHHPEDFTSEYSNILRSMPAYMNIATILSFRNDYIL